MLRGFKIKLVKLSFLRFEFEKFAVLKIELITGKEPVLHSIQIRVSLTEAGDAEIFIFGPVTYE